MEVHSRRMNALRLVGLVAAVLVAGLAQPAAAATNTEATQKAINFLSRDVADWVGSHGCAACHRAGGALYGMASAKGNGYDMNVVTGNGRTNAGNMDFVAARIKGEQRADGSWIHDGGLYQRTKTSYAAFGLAGYDNFVSTQYSNSLVSVANWALTTQNAGRWIEDHGTFPTTFGNVPVTARIMVALAQARQRVDPAKAAQYQAALDRAAAYLRANMNNNASSAFGDGMAYTHEISWAIVGLKAAGPGANGENTAAINTLADKLMARSAANSPAWGSVNGTSVSDGYTSFNTGIAIYALCVAGREPDAGGRLLGAIEWLKSQQNPAGYWGSGGFIDIPTTFASLGLSCYGDHSVIVSVEPPDRQVVQFAWAVPQTVTYFIKVKNHGFQPDSYTLKAEGGLPGWTSELSQTSLFLPAGAEGTLQLKVTVPPDQFPSLSSEVTVTAVSGANPGVTGSARVLTYTNPPPPQTGRETVTTILTPAANATVTVGDTVMLSARVNARDNNELVRGAGRGVVTFFVAGVAIGADNDADGNGVFEVPFNPLNGSWNATGAQDYRAVYSGVTLAPNPNLLGSVGSQTLNIKPYPFAAPSVTQCIVNNPYVKSSDFRACGYVTPRQNGAVVEYIAFIINGGAPIVVAPTPENMSSGFVETMVKLVDGPNVIQLTARDSFGGITTKQYTVNVDTQAPALTIVSPSEGQALGSSTVKVTATVDDRSPVRITTNNIVASNLDAGGGTVTHTLTLTNRGLNTIVVTATDKAGNATERRFQVWVDYRAPVVSSTPADGAIVGKKAGDVLPYTVRVDSMSATTVEVAGGVYPLARGGGVVQLALPLVPGINTLPIKVTAETGLVTNVTRTVKYDTQAPVAVTTIPTAGGTYSGTITLTARVTDNLSNITAVGFMRNRSGIRAGVAGANNTWTLVFDTNELPDGKHTINVRVADAVGNVAIYDTEFFVNNSGARVADSGDALMAAGGEEASLTTYALVAGDSAEPVAPGVCTQGEPAAPPAIPAE